MHTGPPRTKRRLSAVTVLLALLATLLGAGWTTFAPAARAASLTEVTGFGTNPGNLRMFRYVPDGLPAGRPLVVAMHGCTQSAAAFDTETGWTTWADRWGFALLLPQQQSGNNLNSCFNWFESADIKRGSGEALSIKQMTDRMKSDLGSDPARVHATGLSAGAAMTNVMLAAYPDVFASGAPVAGLPYACATTVAAAYTCMSPGTNHSPAAWGDKVRAAYPGYAGPWPAVSVWQGTSDTTVVPANMTETVEQWTNVHATDTTADTTDTVAGYPHAVYRDTAGRPVVETYSITGMGHGQPVDPGAGAEQCGTAGAYILDVNLCASYRIGQFWGLSGGGTPPPGGGTKTVVVPSRAADDGYVKASATGGAPAVGTLEGTYGVAVGRGADGQHNRALLSFDTSSVPDGATVKRAYVSVTYASGSGDPWASGNRMAVDVRSGCFGAACATGGDDWSAAASASEVAEIGRFTSGAQTSTDFTAVNDTGTTQVRLRLTSAPATTAYVFLKSGASATLTVEWE
ncbi:PHB depolymerase family esterase [Streptomyces sp. ISL-96]|uniref:extracellular catalytic domain type 1 short-chain-length polyhydroxyalkanoate depolymerase n=1 Tax=Streptomyces sp. ISL-96 TaxID=2819191 RepID=UPI001BECEAE6|nr:PHB depolymerase family esterase [Streptomyces sp. ISL-96]MBT2490974.1 PHB depolymerase family esterase [Streptomyces sp. ISL-96]